MDVKTADALKSIDTFMDSGHLQPHAGEQLREMLIESAFAEWRSGYRTAVADRKTKGV